MKQIKPIILIFCTVLLNIVIVNSQVGVSSNYMSIGSPSLNTQYYNPSFTSSYGYTSPSIYWPEFDKEVCKERQDFIIQVAPAGCEPTVVRSDLLEERNVPVFCKLMLIQANPLIDVSRVRSIRFPGKMPEGVAGMSYFPSYYRLQETRNLADTPIDDNMGYFVVSLKSYKTEKEMPDWIQGNLTAVVDYEIEDALGIGKTYFYVSELDSEEWLRDYQKYSFWNGKGYIKTESIEDDRVTVSIYRDLDTKQSTITLKKGETSSPIYLGGFYCAAGLKINVEKIETPKKVALLQIDDKQTWVAKDDRIIDNQCKIEGIDIYPGGGKVSLSCPVKDGRFDLKLSPGRIMLNISEKNQSSADYYNLGSEIKDNIYLGYVGSWQETKTLGEEKTKFAVFVYDEYSENEVEFQDKNVYAVVEKIISEKKSSFSDLTARITQEIVAEYKRKIKDVRFEDKKVKIVILEEGKEEEIGNYTFHLPQITLVENKNWEQEENASKLLAYNYYKEAIKNYEDLADLYPYEKRIEEKYFEPYSAEGLYYASVLAKNFNMTEDQEEFLSRLIRDYPDSAWTRKAKAEKENLIKYDSAESRALVSLRSGSYFIELLDFKTPSKEDLSADLLIEGKSVKLGEGEVYNLPIETATKTDKGSVGSVGSVQVTKIENNYVEVSYNKPGLKTGTTGFIADKLDLENKKQRVFEDVTVKLVNINLKKQAKLYLDSEVKGPRAYTNFSFRIGIEKRGIKLSPEKTKEMMENIEESIKKWESINEKLGKVVKGLKTACFATAAILNIKNLVTGFSGDAMARKEVMTKTNGWNDYCEGLASTGLPSKVNEKTYSSVDSCLVGHNSFIEKDISVYSQQIQATNKRLEAAKQGLEIKKTDILDIEGELKNRNAMEENFKQQISSECTSWSNIELPEKAGTEAAYLDREFCNWGSFDNMKEVSTLYNTYNAPGGSQVLQDSVKADLSRVAKTSQNYHDYEEERRNAQAELDKNGLGIKTTLLFGENINYANIKTLNSADISTKFAGFGTDADTKLNKSDKIMSIFIPASEPSGTGKPFTATSEIKNQYAIVRLKEKTKGVYVFDEAYTKEGRTSDAISADVNEYLMFNKANQFKESDAKAYENRMKVENLQVKYFDRAPYKGLPAEVPFDIENGWYVRMEYVLSGFGKPYDESGRAVNYYICNVGSNRIIEFKKAGDDICRYYNGVSEELGFPGMSTSESKQLVARAQNAIAEAAKYYGKKEAMINGRKLPTGLSFAGEGGRCSDFMSPSDCNLMFNVCDPVICPSSRCNLGGAYTVDNVIQTGIIGSIVLCLPNIKEGIYIPVCLSGVHAGIEGYLSILKAEQACLNESLTTGRNIGICDEIKSIYLCEFFWKQLAPFMDVLIPKLIESLFSQGTRGGGEYLTVQAAWDNTQSSIDYFKNDYAVNSMKAFNMRSTEEAGTEVCKSFISSRLPTDFDLLTEPDSPVQYHAWFDENIMTTATPYPTSHYKVYYHIYAGKDQGAYYIVYLKDISEEFTSYYIHTAGNYVVDRGYIATGGYVDQAKDFIAPSGYKQLCVNINGQDECDFGKVSTSYAINYLSDQYAADQAQQQITTSKECVAGTPSLWSMAQPNLQAGAEEVVQPELYNQGITRVCSTYNPGKQVSTSGQYDTTNSTSDRWKDVGYCDDKTLRCWLDTDSVRDVIKDRNMETSVLNEVDTSVIGQKGYLTVEKSMEIANSAEESINNLKIQKGETNKNNVENSISKTATELNDLANLGYSNAHKARGIFLLGKLYDRIVNLILGVGEAGTPTTNIKNETKVQEFAPGEGVKPATICDKEELTTEPREVGTEVQDVAGTIWTKLGEEDDHLWASAIGNYEWEQIQGPIMRCSTMEGEVEPEEPTEKFTLSDNNEILQNGEGTGLFIKEASGKTLILLTKDELRNINVGSVASGKLIFEENYYLSTKPSILELTKKLEGATISGDKIILTD